MKKLLLCLVCILSFLIMRNESFATDYYVSETATNGYIVGVDANAGTSKATAKLTVANAIATSSTGDIIYINSGTYAGAELGAGGYSIIAKGITLKAEIAGEVVFQPSVTTAGVRFQGPAGVTQGLEGIVIDGVNSAAIPNYSVLIEDVAGVYTVNIVNCDVRNATFYLIESTANELNLTVSNLKASATAPVNTRSIIHGVAFAEGAIVIDGVVGEIQNILTAAFHLIHLKATVAGVTASVKNVYANGYIVSTATSTGLHGGIYLVNIADAVIEGCSVNIFGAYGSRTASLYWVTADTTIDTTGAIIRNNRGVNATTGGYLIVVGSDATSAGNNYTNDARVSLNRVYGSGQSSSVHGIMFGFNQGGIASQNIVGNAGLSLLAKQSISTFVANLVLHPQSIALYAKGSTLTKFTNNTIYWDGQDLVTYGAVVGEDSGVNSRFVHFDNNLFIAHNSYVPFVFVNNSQYATFATNHYWTNQRLVPAPWSYQGTSYATLALWLASEYATDERMSDPLLQDYTSTFKPLSYSPLIRSGRNNAVDCTDVFLTPCFAPRDIGAIQSQYRDGRF
jgi:hypothetical protein